MNTKLLFLLLLISSTSYGQNWTQMDVSEFANDASAITLTHNANNEPFIAYTDTSDNMLYVKKHDGTSWVNVGGAVTAAVNASMISIDIDPSNGNPWIAYKNSNTNRLDIVMFNGTNWVVSISSLSNFAPKKKIIIKISPNSEPFIAVEQHVSNTNKRFILYTKRVGLNWSLEVNRGMDFRSEAFDLVAYNKFIVADRISLTSGNDIRFKTYNNTSGTTWSATTLGNVSIYNTHIYGLSIAANAHNDRVIYHLFGHWGANKEIHFLNGATPLNYFSLKSVADLEYSSITNNYYTMFLDSNDDLIAQKYDPITDNWCDLIINLNGASLEYKSKMDVNTTGNKLLVAYIDTNNKIAVKSMDIPVSFTGQTSQVYVDVNATGANDGSSWQDAYTDLQMAINNPIKSCPGPYADLWVAQGVYIPTTSSSNARKATFTIDKRIKIYGGFNGTETLLSERNPKLYPTILSGDLNSDDTANMVDTEATRQDNAYHVVRVKGYFLKGGLVDGVTITGGNANGSLSNSCNTAQSVQFDDRIGAAIYGNVNGAANKVTMQFTNCIIEKNTGTVYGTVATFNPCGAVGTRATLDFESCIIRGNYSKLYENIAYTGSQSYDIRRYGSLINCLIYNNKTDGANRGAVILISSGGTNNHAACTVDIINTTITNNIAPNNHAVKLSMTNAAGHIYNSIIHGNGSTQPIRFSGNAPTSANNIIEGGQLSGSTANPLFMDIATKDFTLQSGSTAINTGDNSFVPTSISYDLLNHVRIYNTTVDMGCYEYGSSSTASISDRNLVSFVIYPNPANDVLHIKTIKDFEKAEVYDLLGKKVLESNNEIINISNLHNGVYLIKVMDNSFNTSVKHFIKK